LKEEKRATSKHRKEWRARNANKKAAIMEKKMGKKGHRQKEIRVAF